MRFGNFADVHIVACHQRGCTTFQRYAAAEEIDIVTGSNGKTVSTSYPRADNGIV
jgi:hypothetical protein